ncbi:FAD-dependent oxidoreductase [Aspergillus mulundensis]|uniref:FAD-binding domain-containing protein n=1 Tax=Aspergillus mulundensis TaxID=1810919 RepID=A0A3D8QN68_9EURO|nr:Uncharacterized protein DSM5745_10015 [Aspergillus mulundensis]RDW62904.1 Uncharacterized protein DSM5745_10015 [Aspergillus mulundensis]
MKVIIIGGGISGCTAYLQLKRHLPQLTPPSRHEITIYEAYETDISTTNECRDGQTHSSSLVVGGGLGVFPNGLRVLKRLDEDILRDVVREGYVIAHQDLKSKNGRLLLRMDSTADPDPDMEGQRMHLLGISRHSLWSSLRRRIPDRDIQTKRVSRVVANQDGRNMVYFADESSSVDADLVIGADGLKGITKSALFLGQEICRPEYQGLVGVGGFISADEVQGLVEKGSMSLVFGGNGFFGYFFSNSSLSAPDRDSPYHVSEAGQTLAWWSTYAVDSCPDPKNLDMDTVVKQLRERHAHWRDPVIAKILLSLRVSSMYPTWTSSQLPRWESDGVVLVGDAAHALPSTSGQGSSQALEDVEALAMLLGHALQGVYSTGSADTLKLKAAITTAARRYEAIRYPRVRRILENAQRMQSNKRDMGFLTEYMMYCGLWIAGCFPKLMSRFTQRVINYDIAEDVRTFVERQMASTF